MTDFKKQLEEWELENRDEWREGVDFESLQQIAHALVKENEQMKESMRDIQQTIPSSLRWTHNELAHWVGAVDND